MSDTRIAYGVFCSWWDSVDKVRKRDGLPCCPHCQSVLFELPNRETWMEGARRYEAEGHPGYVAFVEWARGKCFPNYTVARAAYDAARALH